MGAIGIFTLILTLISAIISLFFLLIKRKNEEGCLIGLRFGALSCGGVLLSSVILISCLIFGDYSIEYVYQHTERALPLIYKISAFWSGSSGSMLFWASILASMLLVIYFNNKNYRTVSTVFGAVMVLITGFIFVVTIINNPFKGVNAGLDGFGLNPALQSVGMVFHPPLVIIGFSCFFIAFGYSLHDMRIKSAENSLATWKWAIWGWALLTLGILSGGLWAYSELGWGGYWAWDPIENSSLVNWLFATAFLHSMGRKDNTKAYNKRGFILLSLTCFTILIGTYLARSGALESVHAYSSQGASMVLIGLIVVFFAVAAFIYIKHRKANLQVIGQEENSSAKFKSYFSSDNLVILVLVTTAALIFGATLYPLYGGIFGSNETVVGETFYNIAFGVTSLIMILLMGICPYLSSGRIFSLVPGALVGLAVFTYTSYNRLYSLLVRISLAVCIMLLIHLAVDFIICFKANKTSKIKINTIILHISIVLIALGVTGSKGIVLKNQSFISKGETVYTGEYAVTYKDLSWRQDKGTITAIAVLELDKPEGSKTLYSELTHYQKLEMNHSRAIIKSGLSHDLYIIFEGLDESDRILLKVMVLKWVLLVWLGGGLLVITTIIQFYLKSAKRRGMSET